MHSPQRSISVVGWLYRLSCLSFNGYRGSITVWLDIHVVGTETLTARLLVLLGKSANSHGYNKEEGRCFLPCFLTGEAITGSMSNDGHRMLPCWRSTRVS